VPESRTTHARRVNARRAFLERRFSRTQHS
jgi:hypothetical protein